MRIEKSIIAVINNSVTDFPVETGGILGSHDGNVIDKVVMDIPAEELEKTCSYSPNVDFLNQNIRSWQEQNISFMGIFHTHFMSVKTLSCGDKKYITEIMNAMPDDITCLYFPVFVLPDRILVCYKAHKTADIVKIISEQLQIES